jgi:hypothetical protein
MKHPERLQRRVLARKKCESVQIISVALQMAMSGVMVTLLIIFMLETGSGARSAPEADECFDGEFFGAGGIAHDSGDDACDAVESGAEEGLDVEGGGGRGCRFEDDVAGGVHIHITMEGRSL